MKKIIIAIFCISVFFACNNSKENNNSKKEVTSLGIDFQTEKAVTVKEAIDKLGEKESIPLTIKGEVSAVCKTMGCWMELKNDNGKEIFVQIDKSQKFKFPKDLTGKVILQGKLNQTITSVEFLKKEAEEAKKSPEEIEKITEPKVEYSFLAQGVKRI